MQLQEYSQETLYGEFLAYIKGGKKKTLETKIESEYKKLFSELHKSNDYKRVQLEKVENREINMKSSGCKFTKLEGYKELSTLKDSYVLYDSRMAVDVDKENLEDSIVMEESLNKQLMQEIDDNKICLSNLKKQICKIKADIKLIDLKENKFLEAYTLANNIVQFADQHSIINMRNYNKMLEEHDDILIKLKKMRVKAKNELSDAQHQLQISQKEHDIKYRKMIKSSFPTEDQELARKANKIPRGFNKFLESIESVLELLESNEENYESIKLQECTKVHSKKVDIDLLSPDRADWSTRIQEFENRFQMRVESTDKILIKLYKQIKEENEQIERRIFERKCAIEDAEEESKTIDVNYNRIETEEETKLVSKETHTTEMKKSFQIQSNSRLLIQTMEQITLLLMKFRYIYKLFVMLNIDKRKVSEQLTLLDEVLENKNAFNISSGVDSNGNSIPNGIKTNEDTNVAEMLEIFKNYFEHIDVNKIREALAIYFNDSRASLIWKRTVIVEELQESKSTSSCLDFLKILESIREECESAFNKKLKSSLKTLHECLKSSSRNSGLGAGFRLEMRQKNGFMSAPLYFPTGMFSKPIVPKDEFDEEEIPTETPELKKWAEETALKNEEKERPEQWGEEEKKNPSAMIRKLAAIRNETNKKIHVLNLHEHEKKFIKMDVNFEESDKSKENNLVTTSSECKSNLQESVTSSKNLKEVSKANKSRSKQTELRSKLHQTNNFISA